MNRVGEFEKVSFEQFYTAIKDEFGTAFELADATSFYEGIQLPTRATSGSAGYDFKAPFGFYLDPGETIKIPTGIRVKSKKDGGWAACLEAGLVLSTACSSIIRWGSSTLTTIIQATEDTSSQR